MSHGLDGGGREYPPPEKVEEEFQRLETIQQINLEKIRASFQSTAEEYFYLYLCTLPREQRVEVLERLKERILS